MEIIILSTLFQKNQINTTIFLNFPSKQSIMTCLAGNATARIFLIFDFLEL